MRLFLYSHTHWDREWYLSQNQFQLRLIRTVDEIIDLLLEDNSFDCFVLDGQTSLIDDYLELRPERRETIRALVRNRQFVIGPWFTMPDVFLPDGEALLRNLAQGCRDVEGWGGRVPNVGYVPDSFGHIEQLPQLLRGVGIDTFVFSRGRPESLASSPREFTWRAPDGSAVLAWYLPGSYVAGSFLPNPKTDPEGLKARIEAVVDSYADSAVPDIVLVPHGIDHCWIQRDLPEILDALPKLMPEHEMSHGDIESALNEWKRHAPADLPVYEGPLRGRLSARELHGTLSSRMDNKLGNEHAQTHLENWAEPLDALAVRRGKAPAPWFHDKAWRLLFFNHAHDSICGCSQDRVHADVNTRFREVTELATDIADGALDYLNNDARRDQSTTLAVFAGLSGGTRVVPFMLRTKERRETPFCWRDDTRTECPVQVQSHTPMRVQHSNAALDYWECRGFVRIPDLQPCEVRRLAFCDAAAPPVDPPVAASHASLDNGILRAEVRNDGTLDLTDLRTGRRIAGTHAFVQEGDRGGGYHFEPVPGDRRRSTRDGDALVETVLDGPLRACLRVRTSLTVPLEYDRATQRRSEATVDVPIVTEFALNAGEDTLQCRTTIDNRARHQRIRLSLPTGTATREVRADAAFATHTNTPDKWPADERQNSHPMRSFVHIEDPDGGFAFVGRGLHEYEILPNAQETTLEVTLLRSVDFVLTCCTWETPEAQLPGKTELEYALCLPAPAANMARRACELRNSPIADVYGGLELNPERGTSHATVGYYRRDDDGMVPVDSHRSAWKPIHSQRDGWRRVEDDRFLERTFPQRILPFTIEGEDVLVSAYKPADDGDGEILRFWNAGDVERLAAVTATDRDTLIQPCDLRERALPDEPGAPHRREVRLRPAQICTLRLRGGTAV